MKTACVLQALFVFSGVCNADEARKRSLYDIIPPKLDLPIGFESSRASIIVQAGFDPDTAHIWLLPFDWGNHKEGCIVVAPDLNFQLGDYFAISEESVLSSR